MIEKVKNKKKSPTERIWQQMELNLASSTHIIDQKSKTKQTQLSNLGLL